MKKQIIYISIVAASLFAATSVYAYYNFVGDNNQPPARTNHPMMYGYYELGNMSLDIPNGVLDTEVWLEHMNFGWACRYQIPLQGNITLTEALYHMFQDSGWRATRELPHSRVIFWLPISSFEWIHTSVVPVTDTIMVGEPIFVSMY